MKKQVLRIALLLCATAVAALPLAAESVSVKTSGVKGLASAKDKNILSNSMSNRGMNQMAAPEMRAKTAVVLGAQWGDEGKGKIVDVLSERFTAVARYAGGHNAGHTVIIGEQKFVLQLIPCGVLRPGCRGVIGNGVVLDPIAFLKEVAKLRGAGRGRG
jgi:hypothetical protein